MSVPVHLWLILPTNPQLPIRARPSHYLLTLWIMASPASKVDLEGEGIPLAGATGTVIEK